MNKELLDKIRDPKFYLEHFCRIKNKGGGLIPFLLNEAQKDIFNTLNVYNRVIILKARQIGFCFDPNTKVLTSDLKWKKIKDLNIGDRIIASDENVIGGSGSSRKMRTAIVQGKSEVYESAIRLKVDDGRVLILTPEHRMLCQVRGAVHTQWRKAKDIGIDDKIRYITKPWEENGYEDGWISGIIDGEGCLRAKENCGTELSISQVDGFVWNRILKYFIKNGYSYRVEIDKRVASSSSKYGDKPVNKLVLNKMDELFYLLGKVRPSRFAGKYWWEGKKYPNNGWAKVVSINELSKRKMIDLQTSEKTYIANGFVSHNSTAITGYFYVKTIMNPGTMTVIIGYNSDLATQLLDKVKTFYKTTPPEIRPTIKYNTKYEISFPNMDSTIMILPSTENVGSGYTIHNCLLTELPKIEKAEEKMNSLMPAISQNGTFVIESSPKGQGNLFHRMWMADKGPWVKKEYGWWWGYSQKEIDQIREETSDPQFFAQEYGMEFLSSGRSVFDPKIVKYHREKYQLKVGDDNNGFIVKEEGDWTIYCEVDPNGLYIFGVDVSEGVEGGDYSVITVFNRRNGEEVAQFRGLIPPDRLGNLADEWGRKYNNALMVIEINNHGLTTVTILKQLTYPNMYYRQDKFETISISFSDRIGWKTTKVTRPLLIDELAKAMREKVLIIHSKITFDEMSVFVYNDNGDMKPQEGFHDDTIFATGICFQGFKRIYTNPLTQIDSSLHLPTNFAY